MKASFRLKAGITLWVFWVLVIGAVAFLGHIRAGDTLAKDRARFERLARTMAVAYSKTVFHHPKGVFASLEEEMKHHLGKLVEADKEIVYVAVFDRKGEKICTVQGQGESVKGGDRLIAVPMRHRGEAIGTLQVRLSEDKLRQEAIARRDYTLSLVVVAAAAGLGILLMIDARLRRILGRLIQSVRRMAAGDLAQRIEIHTHDELEELGVAFNRMAQNLAQSEEALRQTNEKLARNVAERTRALSKSEIRYKNLVDSSGDAIVTTDMRGIITFVNRSAEQVFGYFGYGQDEMIGLPISQLYEAGKAEAKEIMAELTAGKTLRNREIRVVGKDHARSVISMSASILRDEWGEPIGTLGVAKDISELKTLQKRLIHSERLAAIGKMSAKIAHEIRNPLGSLSLNAEMLDEEIAESNGATHETRQLVRAMAREIDRLTAITEEYLEFSRVPTPSPTPVDIGEQIRTLAGFMNKEFADRGVMVCLDLNGGAGPALVDRRQMRQCLINLVRNALEAIGEGGRIGLSVLDAGDAVEVRVEDSGPGIAEDAREKILEPFYTTKTGGTGLGLAICSEIVAGHGGQMRIGQSQFGGAAFCLKLPKIPVQDGETGVVRRIDVE